MSNLPGKFTIQPNIRFLQGDNNTMFGNKKNYDLVKNNVAQTIYNNYLRLYTNDYVQEYLQAVVAALMLTFKHPECKILFRNKSANSLYDKARECTEHAIFDSSIDNFLVTGRPICDAFAMTFIIPNSYAERIQSVEDVSCDYNSPDALKLDAEIKKRQRFDGYRQKMTSFRDRLVSDTSQDDKYSVTKKEYIENCISALHLLILASPNEAIQLKEVYSSRLNTLKNCLSDLQNERRESELIDEDFIAQTPENFLSLYNKFVSTLNNRVGMYSAAIKIRDMVRTDNDLLKALGVSISSINKEPPDPIKANGFESYYLYFDTPAGTFEAQIRTKGQDDEATYGNASHSGNYKEANFPSYLTSFGAEVDFSKFIPHKGSAILNDNTAILSLCSTRENFFSTFIAGLPNYPNNSKLHNNSQAVQQLGKAYKDNCEAKYFGLLNFYAKACEAGLLPRGDASEKKYTAKDIKLYLNGQDFQELLYISDLCEQVQRNSLTGSIKALPPLPSPDKGSSNAQGSPKIPSPDLLQ